MELRDGALTIGEWRGVPIRIHWTAPLGALATGGFRIAPAFWLGFAIVVLAHELGHALMVRRFRGTVTAILISGIGGECEWYGTVTATERALIAWGGVLGQAALLACVLPVAWLAPLPGSAGLLVYTLVAWNVLMAAFNLVPIPPLDGAKAWALLPVAFRSLRRTFALARQRAKVRLAAMAERTGPLPTRPEIDEEVKRIIAQASRNVDDRPE